MTRRTVLVGKIGPAFNGTYLASHGSVSSDQHSPDSGILGVAFSAMAENVAEGMYYRTDGAISPDDIRLGDVAFVIGAFDV